MTTQSCSNSRPHSPPLITSLSVQPFSIASAEYAAAMLKAGTPEQLDIAPIGTGPFALDRYQRDSTIRFRAFPEFWGKAAQPERAPKVDALAFSITRDPAVRFAKLRPNECQIARYPNPADREQMRATPGLTIQESTIASLSYLTFRTRNIPQWCNTPFSDLVQQANLVTDQAARAKLYIDAQQVFYDEVPAMMFADASTYVGLRDTVQGFKLHFFGGVSLRTP